MSDKEALLTKKKELEERLEKIKRDIGQKLSADSEEQATELENRDVILEIARVTEEELARVNSRAKWNKRIARQRQSDCDTPVTIIVKRRPSQVV